LASLIRPEQAGDEVPAEEIGCLAAGMTAPLFGYNAEGKIA
jgi:hypothetical protein